MFVFTGAFVVLKRSTSTVQSFLTTVVDLCPRASVIRLSLATTKKCRQELKWFKLIKRKNYLLRRHLTGYQSK
ncbi:unnamed protein product, partial [Vitis vinifera]|uniref:Uncharacterized protein n=1 Tax=Vitis vinifera TaxID=29760 RepID=D7U6Q4_VITVI